jgi:hypothetical protein
MVNAPKVDPELVASVLDKTETGPVIDAFLRQALSWLSEAVCIASTQTAGWFGQQMN